MTRCLSRAALLLAGGGVIASIVASGSGPAAAAPGRARRKHRRISGSLVKILGSADDPRRRETAALSLGVAGDRSALPALHRCLAKDQDRWVRARCAEALGLIGDRRSVSPLRSALSREKHDRVRRAVATALMRLGQKKGLLELMWQLKSGTNHERAEAMNLLAATFGQPHGQRLKGWWTYLARRGYATLARRPGGSPAFVELRSPGDAKMPRVVAGNPRRWKQLCAAVVRLKPTRRAVDAQLLRAYERHGGTIPDGCLLLIASNWQSPAARGVGRGTKSPKKGKAAPRAGKTATPGPGLTAAGLRYLRQRAPHLLGVGVDAPWLDPPAGGGEPVRGALKAAGLLGLAGVGALDRPLGRKFRLLVVEAGPAAGSGRPVVLLAVLR